MSFEWYELDGDMGPGALPSGTATEGWMTGIESRLTSLEETGIPASIDDLDDVDTSTVAPTSGDLLQWDGSTWAPYTPAASTVTFAMPIVIGNSTGVIGTGAKADVLLPFASTITGWTIGNDLSGSIVIEVWADTYANYPPTVADLILTCTVSNAIKAQATGLNIPVPANRILRFNVGSASTVQRATLTLTMTRDI